MSYFESHRENPFQFQVKLLTPTAKVPKRALSNDLGMDIFLCSLTDVIDGATEQFDWHKNTTGCSQVLDTEGKLIGIDIHPGGFAKLPLGFSASFNKGWGAFVFDKSGVGLKGIKYLGGIIDPDFRGPWEIMLANIKTADEFSPVWPLRLKKMYVDNTVRFLVGQKLAQVCFLPIGRPEVVIVDELDTTERVGGFNSTGSF